MEKAREGGNRRRESRNRGVPQKGGPKKVPTNKVNDKNLGEVVHETRSSES